MSPSTHTSPLTSLCSNSGKASTFSCTFTSFNKQSKTSISKLPAPVSKPSISSSAAAAAIKQLNDETFPKLSFPSTSRPLQPVDVNVGKVASQEARCCSHFPASSPKLSSTRVSIRKARPSATITGPRSAAKARNLGCKLGHSASVSLKGERISVKVPQKLPAPRLKPNSSPYEDLVAHLSRHHFFTEAQEVERSSITPDFFLIQYLETARLGKCSLYHQTLNFLEANRDHIMAHVTPGESLPDTVPLDVTAWIETFQRPPTHLLAVHSDSEAATIYAVHGQIFALQCVSIPFLPASKETQENGKTIKDMAVLALRVPCLQHFNTVLRWLYSQSTISLLQELLPLKHIIKHFARRALATQKSTSPTPQNPSVDVSKLSATDLVEAMSTLSTKQYLELLQTIQAVWKNGVALGIVSWNFWTVLDNAWNLIIGAMMVSKRKGQAKVAKAIAASTSELSAQMESTRIG
ncbi:related to clp1, essential for A-regulated sexual development [Melanopsichium pennsylvanicum]|uniref:Related to clp1, essential for A-regulated sexual development n=2 Tax=Melanopsichium pennsylvanicum TaxID=63383 RepID=A0AAJ5C308_9BASI|nr:related to clp1, essential for A-regulated sexual development [Melanopsichium pennsylvanicum 4]SNX82095.1 related to clp1, essential for A-regulated sexual development [Melanopsichium pennsylvanicum]